MKHPTHQKLPVFPTFNTYHLLPYEPTNNKTRRKTTSTKPQRILAVPFDLPLPPWEVSHEGKYWLSYSRVTNAGQVCTCSIFVERCELALKQGKLKRKNSPPAGVCVHLWLCGADRWRWPRQQKQLGITDLISFRLLRAGRLLLIFCETCVWMRPANHSWQFQVISYQGEKKKKKGWKAQRPRVHRRLCSDTEPEYQQLSRLEVSAFD